MFCFGCEKNGQLEAHVHHRPPHHANYDPVGLRLVIYYIFEQLGTDGDQIAAQSASEKEVRDQGQLGLAGAENFVHIGYEGGPDEYGDDVGEDPDKAVQNIRSLVSHHQSSDPEVLHCETYISGYLHSETGKSMNCKSLL